jgi:hypothetical protein
VHTEGGTSWTLLVYMMADNNLENFALSDLQEMMDVGSSDGFNIVVQVDRHAEYTDMDVGGLEGWTSAKRLLVGNNGLTELADLGEINMGDPTVLSDFIAWGVPAYPADRYAFVFWDHGSSWRGFGRDESESTADRLTLTELVQGVKSGMETASLSQFALIGFDACLMATYETAVAFWPFSEYLLASEELEPGHGWDYASLANTKAEPSRDGAQMAQDVLAGYLQQAKNNTTDLEVTLSLVDLTKWKPVQDAVEALAVNLRLSMGAAITHLARERSATVAFGTSPDPGRDRYLIDLIEFAEKVAAVNGVGAEAANNLVAALEAAVVGEVKGPGRVRARGLSVYFPPAFVYYSAGYEELAGIVEWRNLVKTFLEPEAAGVRDIPEIPEDLLPNPLDVGWYSMTTEYEAYTHVSLSEAEAIVNQRLDVGEYDPDTNSLHVFENSLGWVVVPDGWDSALVKGHWAGDAWYVWDGDKRVRVSLNLEDVHVEGVEGWMWVMSVPFRYAPPGHSACDPNNTTWETVTFRFGNSLDGLLVWLPVFYTESSAGLSELVPVAGSTLCPELLVIKDVGLPTQARVWELATVEFDGAGYIGYQYEPASLEANVAMMLTVWDFSHNYETIHNLGPATQVN